MTLSLSTLVPLAANAAPDHADACSIQSNGPLVLRRVLPQASASERRAIARVSVSREGLVRHVSLLRTSGDARFDAAALRATEATAFAPAARTCVAIESSFDYELVSRGDGDVRTAVVPASNGVLAARH